VQDFFHSFSTARPRGDVGANPNPRGLLSPAEPLAAPALCAPCAGALVEAAPWRSLRLWRVGEQWWIAYGFICFLDGVTVEPWFISSLLVFDCVLHNVMSFLKAWPWDFPAMVYLISIQFENSFILVE
jgi:hypothetical protein